MCIRDRSTAAALQSLRAESVRVVMLTGDSKTTAQAVAARLGIEDVYKRQILGRTGLALLERLMGLILAALAVQLIVHGVQTLLE